MELNYDNKEQYLKITDEGELVIDDEITEISNGTFVDFNDLDIKKIRISKNVKKLGCKLFLGLKNIEEIVLPDGLEKIGEQAFQSCVNLKRINIPSNVQEIGWKAFCDCESLENIELPDKITIIENSVFENCKKIEKIVIPKNVYSIGNTAFSRCSSLKEVVLNDGIHNIGKETFYNCVNLENINFPNSLEKENNSFLGCSKNIIKTIPARLVCDKNGVLKKFYSEFLIDNTFIIPEGVKRIEKLEGWYNFYVKNIAKGYRENSEEHYERTKKFQIEEIEIPDSVLAIGEEVFVGFDFLKKVNMPDSIIELGKENFGRCFKLEKIRLSRNLKSIPNDVVESLRNSSLNCLILPDSIQEITGGYKFNNKSSYEFNKDTITYFSKKDICKLYDSINEGSSQQISVTEKEIFKYFSINGERIPKTEEKNTNVEKQITMSDIKDLDKRKKMIISSDNIKKIGSFALSQSPNLEEVYIEEGITEIGPGAFAECENLKKVHFPRSLRKISDYAFFDCNKLEEIKILSKSVTIGDFCFSNCNSLQFAELPKRVENVGRYAFCDCSKLKYVSGMNDVDKIEQSAFERCEQLKISLPQKIKEIGSWAYAKAGTKNWNFENINDDKIIDYPFNETIIIIPASLEKLGKGVFFGCKGITQLYFNQGSNLKEIPYAAFYECNLMSFVEFPDEMMKINDYAFAGCESLEEIYFPKEIQEIGKQSFSNCKALRLAMFKGGKKGEELAKADAFDGCENLKIINLSDLEFNTKKLMVNYMMLLEKKNLKKCILLQILKRF
ncbi:MAG: leucine-rich repeat protein [Clostridia bacterium]|nr:leucine-rich repeat protein [Clostridia bacterium]